MKDKEAYISPERMHQFTSKASDNVETWTPEENRIRKKKRQEALDHEKEGYIAPERMERFTTKASDEVISWSPAENVIRDKKKREALDHARDLEVKRRNKAKRTGKWI